MHARTQPPMRVDIIDIYTGHLQRPNVRIRGPVVACCVHVCDVPFMGQSLQMCPREESRSYASNMDHTSQWASCYGHGCPWSTSDRFVTLWCMQHPLSNGAIKVALNG